MHVAQDNMPVELVARDMDGDWQYFCQEVHDFSDLDQFTVVAINQLEARQPDLLVVRKLLPGRRAVRYKGSWRAIPLSSKDPMPR